MSSLRRSKKIDENQHEIVDFLKKHGCKVELDCDDILVSIFHNNTYLLKWIEIKSSSPFKKNGTLKAGKFIKDKQYKLLESWDDNYAICWTPEGALCFVLGDEGDYITPSKYRANLSKWKPELTPSEKADIIFSHFQRGL